MGLLDEREGGGTCLYKEDGARRGLVRRLIGGKSLVRAGLGKEELGLAVGLRSL